MASNVFSRLAPSRGTRSFYEELRSGDGDDIDPEEHAMLNVDEENLKERFHDYDVDHAAGLAVDDSHLTVDSVAQASSHSRQATRVSRTHTRAQGRHIGSRWFGQEDDVDNDVPASLLVESHDVDPLTNAGQRRKPQPVPAKQKPIPGPSTRKSRAQWEAAQAQQRLHHEDTFSSTKSQPNSLATGVVSGSAKEKALWRWANVSNLDNFMRDVYQYYQGKGMWCILCERALHVVQSAFVAVFLTFLTQCIDYPKIPGSKALREVVIPQCTRKMSLTWNAGLWLCTFYLVWKIVQFVVDLGRLQYLRNFYVHLLGISDEDMQTICWQDVVISIMALRDVNPKTARATAMTPYHRRWIGSQSKERLDAHDIANRLMRRDNYLIAMINKDILRLTIQVPFLGSLPFVKGRQFYSRTLEWYLQFSILDFVFDDAGQVNQEFLKVARRGQLSQKLKQRFVFAGIVQIISIPFLVAYLVIVYFFTYYQEYQRDPSTLGTRRYTPLAEWKFREFNELDHIFFERLNMSYPFATRYNDQFPKQMTEQLARTIAFMAGAVTAVLAVASFLDPQLFLGFEITHDRTALFYIGVFAAIWAAARGNISEDTLVFDPEYAFRNVINYTHFCPEHWKGRLHSFDVKREFSELYKLKLVIFIEELLGILTSPILLMSSLPSCSDQIVDFFREFTVHVDGLGYVCSFAVFDFSKGLGNAKQQPGGADMRQDHYSTKHGKMAASYYGFLDNYVMNPKTGIPRDLPPGPRHQFYPPPAFPGLNSPTLAAEMHGSRLGRGDRARSRPGGPGQSARTPRFGPAMLQPSPMASMLLDPDHQPPGFGARSVHRPRTQRGPYQAEGDIIEESLEDGLDGSGKQGNDEDDDDVYESEALGESTWETSPAKTLSRENSATVTGNVPEAGVLGLIYQLQQQAHRNQRPGGVV